MSSRRPTPADDQIGPRDRRSAPERSRYPQPERTALFRPDPNHFEVIVPDGPQGATNPTHRPLNDLQWAEQVLFAHPNLVLRKQISRHESSAAFSWTALPMKGPIRRLVPTSAQFAPEAFANDHDAMSKARRALGSAARVWAQSGALRFANQLQADARLVFEDPTSSVIAAAATALGQPIAACAITLGPRRYNRKPVVQLMNPSARTVGYLKVGANDLTSAMVATEAATVDQLDGTNDVLRLPTVLWRSDWQGRSVACFSPVSVPPQQLVAADTSRLVQVARAVVEAGGGHQDGEFQDSALLVHVRDLARSNDRVHRQLDRAEAMFAGHQVSAGQWHGDFSPWNMISNANSTALIDWEFASDAMPVGADLLHNRVMVATHLRGEAPGRALRALRDGRHDLPELHAMGVPSDQHRAHVLLYLFELVRRDLELQQANQPDTGFGLAAQAVIEAILAGHRQ